MGRPFIGDSLFQVPNGIGVSRPHNGVFRRPGSRFPMRYDFGIQFFDVGHSNFRPISSGQNRHWPEVSLPDTIPVSMSPKEEYRPLRNVSFEIFIRQVAVGFSNTVKFVYDLQLAMSFFLLIETCQNFLNPIWNSH